MKRVNVMKEWIDENLMEREGLKEFKKEIKKMNKKEEKGDIEIERIKRRRIEYDEFMEGKMEIEIVREKNRRI